LATYKTFNDLVENKDYALKRIGMSQGRLDFDNGYGVSVIHGPYTTGGCLFEMAIFFKDQICFVLLLAEIIGLKHMRKSV